MQLCAVITPAESQLTWLSRSDSTSRKPALGLIPMLEVTALFLTRPPTAFAHILALMWGAPSLPGSVGQGTGC